MRSRIALKKTSWFRSSHRCAMRHQQFIALRKQVIIGEAKRLEIMLRQKLAYSKDAAGNVYG